MIYRTPQLNQSIIIIAVLDFKPDMVVSKSSVCIMTDAVPVIRPRGARTPALGRHVGCLHPVNWVNHSRPVAQRPDGDHYERTRRFPSRGFEGPSEGPVSPTEFSYATRDASPIQP